MFQNLLLGEKGGGAGDPTSSGSSSSAVMASWFTSTDGKVSQGDYGHAGQQVLNSLEAVSLSMVVHCGLLRYDLKALLWESTTAVMRNSAAAFLRAAYATMVSSNNMPPSSSEP